jgi:CHAT domain-containing protein
VVDPLALPDGTRRLLISPAGALAYVPFAAVVPEVVVAYEPSGAAYAQLLEDAARRGAGVLALGDPDPAPPGDGVDAGDGGRGSRFGRLPGSREEARKVGDVVLLGSEATESRLQRALAERPRWRAVHLACHGRIDAEHPFRSALLLTPDPGGDGELTVLEVFRMRIPADLAVLSACETAKGRVVRGEGIVGPMRAFLYAGSPRVLCSLWKVDDEATKALMVRFYELWNPKDGSKGMGAAEALRRAQAFVRDHPDHPEWKHPCYWAAWVLWGLPD